MKLSSYMEQNGWDDAKMATLIGQCTASAVKKWRSGERFPRMRTIIRIRDITGGEVSANDFVSPELESGR